MTSDELGVGMSREQGECDRRSRERRRRAERARAREVGECEMYDVRLMIGDGLSAFSQSRVHYPQFNIQHLTSNIQHLTSKKGGAPPGLGATTGRDRKGFEES